MNETIQAFKDLLKKRIIDNKDNWVEHHSMCGSTEGGFYDTDEVDMDKLMKEIDDFCHEFINKKQT